MTHAPFRLPEGVRATVSLTYDGGHVDQREGAFSVLNALGLRATFFPSALHLIEHADEWRRAQALGHEIGNGAALDLTFAQQMDPEDAASLMREDSAEFHGAFQTVIGSSPRSAALPWYHDCPEGDQLLGPGLSEPLIRTGIEGFNYPNQTNPRRLHCIAVDNFNGSDLIQLVRAAMDRQAWLIFAFAGIGTGDPGIDFSAHQQLAVYLANTADSVLVSPVTEIGSIMAPTGNTAGLS